LTPFITNELCVVLTSENGGDNYKSKNLLLAIYIPATSESLTDNWQQFLRLS